MSQVCQDDVGQCDFIDVLEEAVTRRRPVGVQLRAGETFIDQMMDVVTEAGTEFAVFRIAHVGAHPGDRGGVPRRATRDALSHAPPGVGCVADEPPTLLPRVCAASAPMRASPRATGPPSATPAPPCCTPIPPYCLLTRRRKGGDGATPARTRRSTATPSSASSPCATTASSPRPGCPAPSRTSPPTRRSSSGPTCWARSPSHRRARRWATPTCAASTSGASAPPTRTPTSSSCASTRSPSSSPARPSRRSLPGTCPRCGPWSVATTTTRRPRSGAATRTTSPSPCWSRWCAPGAGRGDTVLDPFAGSGSMPSAALRLGRRPACMEVEPEWAERVTQRLRDTARQLAQRAVVARLAPRRHVGGTVAHQFSAMVRRCREWPGSLPVRDSGCSRPAPRG